MRNTLKIISLLSILLLLPSATRAQASVWDSWDGETVRRLHTGRDIPYLNDEEQKVILFMNMARHDGPLFAETFVKTYVEENQIKNTGYLRSLNKLLDGVSKLDPLSPVEDLTAVAQVHANKSGPEHRHYPAHRRRHQRCRTQEKYLKGKLQFGRSRYPAPQNLPLQLCHGLRSEEPIRP